VLKMMNLVVALSGFLLWGAACLAVSPAAAEEPAITLERAQQLALEHNHGLRAARTGILQNEAQEMTAGLRPNPVLSGDALYLPFTDPGRYASDGYLNQTAQFDLGLGYTWERGGKRNRRLLAAHDATSVTRSQVADNERTLKFSVAAQFVNVLLAQSNLEFSERDQENFCKTVEVSETRFKAGDLSEVDYLKIKLQLLQFENAVHAARLAKAQALVALRELLGHESVPAEYEVSGTLEYRPLAARAEDIRAAALRERPDLRAAQQAVTAARSQHDLAKANSHQDVTTTLNLTHVAGSYTAGVQFSFPLAFFDRNQGEIARTENAISQAREVTESARETVLADVDSAYEAASVNEKVVSLYRNGYLENAEKSREISEYAYRRGGASLLDLLDAERSYSATGLAYRQALAAYLLALEQLKAAAGWAVSL